MNQFHEPVMVAAVLEQLALRSNDAVIDCTLGGAGHVVEYLKLTAPAGRVLGIDLDPLAISVARTATKPFGQRVVIARGNFKDLRMIAHEHGFNQVRGVIFDLGLSSGQLQDKKRGFSFLADGDLDMRFGSQTDITAGHIVNTYSEQQLTEIFQTFGEERLARPIAKQLIALRKKNPITQPAQIVQVIADVYRRFFRGNSRTNPATKVFQALRIAVNEELENLAAALPQAVDLLEPLGRIVVISYHSLEDRIVKDFFKQESRDCICPPENPQCICGHVKTLKIVTKKPIEPTDEEIALNPRARSAKMRVAEKINFMASKNKYK